MTIKISMIITAGGMSTRHPPNKLLTQIDGETVIEKTVKSFIQFPVDVFVVTGNDEKNISTALKGLSENITLIHNLDYQSGISSSVRAGVSVIDNCDYFGFCTGDKPFIQQSTIQYLLGILEMRSPEILVPEYESIPGHPVFFSYHYKSRLLALSGDEGGRQIIRHLPHETEIVSVGDKGVILDMDKFLKEGKIE
ncbi:MAG: NTP transferase domain-containing protein [Candidatus Marinimicrobia bacterium]|nr:NTP transferase domain-containing protein [Candidatus Neomarinimicrobiota bacterium]